MGAIQTVDEGVLALVKRKMRQHAKTIRAAVAAEAERCGHDVTVKKIELMRLDLPQKDLLAFELGPMNVAGDDSDVTLFSMEYVNNSDTTDSTTFADSRQRSDGWHWQLQSGYTSSTTAKAQLVVGEVSETVQVNLQGTYGETGTETHEWSWNASPQVPPRRRVVMSAVLKQMAGSMPFTCRVRVDGKVHCRGRFGVKIWPDQIREFDIPLQRLLSEDERTYTTTGTISGARGQDVHVEKNQLPLSAAEQSRLPLGPSAKVIAEPFALDALALS